MINKTKRFFVRCEYIPRGAQGSPLTTPLNFIGELLRPAIEEGRYIVRIGTTAYKIQVQDLWECTPEELEQTKTLSGLQPDLHIYPDDRKKSENNNE